MLTDVDCRWQAWYSVWQAWYSVRQAWYFVVAGMVFRVTGVLFRVVAGRILSTQKGSKTVVRRVILVNFG